MSKLFNGSIWKRTVVKDQNRFSMPQTCLCLAMTFHIEEWRDFLNKEGAFGMQGRCNYATIEAYALAPGSLVLNIEEALAYAHDSQQRCRVPGLASNSARRS